MASHHGMSYCPKCGSRVDEEMRFCPKCGASLKLEKVVTVPPPPPQYQPAPYRRKTHRGRNIAIGCILILIVVLGLYYYTAIQQLQVNIVGVGLLSAGITSAQVEVTVEVRNPSLVPIYISSGDFTVYVNNQRLGYGSFGSFTVGGNSNQRVPVTISFSYVDVGMTIANLITGGGTVDIRLDGAVNTFVLSISFSQTLYNAKFG